MEELVTAVLRSSPKETFADSFQMFYERCQPSVVKDADYFGGQIKLIYLYLLICLFSGTIQRTF
jgi:hypothetical protein